MKVIIFGIGGQDGFYLKKMLIEKKFEVIGISRSSGNIKGSVSDYFFVKELINHSKPCIIFHLAANSSTRHDVIFENHETISTGTLNILEAVRLYSPESKIFLSGSAMQFKNEGVPISENTPFEATSPYAISRIQSTYAGRYYRSKFGLKVYNGFFFNHDSPLRSEQHVNQKIVRAAQRIAGGSNEKLLLGNIDVEKEFGYAEDIVKAVWKLVNQDFIYEAVIGTGKSYSIRFWLDLCFRHFKLDWKDHIQFEQGYKPEYSKLVSNPSLIRSIGWDSETSIEGLAKIMLKN